MRKLILLALLLPACAHERTEIDREALLKIIDRPAAEVKIVQAPAPNIVINNGSGYSQPVQTYQQPPQEHGSSCVNVKEYSGGEVVATHRQCFGSDY